MTFRVMEDHGTDGRTWADYDNFDDARETADALALGRIRTWVVDMSTGQVLHGDAEED